MIEVILCDDHALIRRGIRDTLSEAVDMRVVGEAGEYGELRSLMRHTRCDVLVLDINLPGRSGLDVLHVLKDESLPSRCACPLRRSSCSVSSTWLCAQLSSISCPNSRISSAIRSSASSLTHRSSGIPKAGRATARRF